MDPTRGQFIYLKIVFGWLLFSTTAILLLSWGNHIHRAVIGMGCGLVWLWVVGCGTAMWRLREPICRGAAAIRLDWRVKFVVFCTLLAMLEEAITTGLTNGAPLFGVRLGQAYITASASYVDVIALHSVSLFVSFFVGWSALLWRYDFSPFAVFVLFGITGTIAETLFGGPQHVLEYAMWSFVYGLMVWLPARSIPRGRGAHSPRWWHYPMAVVAPFLFLPIFPLAAVIRYFAGPHPNIHFPPIAG